MTQRDLFGGTSRVDLVLNDPVELDCAVIAMTDLAARLRFIDVDGASAEAWVPFRLLAFRGAGHPRKGAQLLEIESFKAREIGAI
ncbi:hypothetical protein [Parvibaculum sp.]|uniref:hypothetical protein n=1 Tax=Parvibaculum sp. TaxID=2024848 RepID=UPI001E04FDE0|nr:hypothetical protein [Parvibaculum sp.]MBX3488891.1 hypothetical protein [Parvibaculum sp.]MCW5727227.1 hypothetical protein [Parvibaculum sp.]